MTTEAPEIRVHGNIVSLHAGEEKRLDCLLCGGPIKKPRKGKDFCSDKCRWKYNNNEKKREYRRAAFEVMDIYFKRGLLQEYISGKIKSGFRF